MKAVVHFASSIRRVLFFSDNGSFCKTDRTQCEMSNERYSLGTLDSLMNSEHQEDVHKPYRMDYESGSSAHENDWVLYL